MTATSQISRNPLDEVAAAIAAEERTELCQTLHAIEQLARSIHDNPHGSDSDQGHAYAIIRLASDTLDTSAG